jgi:hypothetical protein
MATRKHAIYRTLPRPQQDAAKGACYLTGSSGPCVDTGILIYGEGTLTISHSALQELCEVAGFSFNAEGQRLEEQVAHMERELQAARDLNTAYEEQLEAVGKAVRYAATKED